MKTKKMKRVIASVIALVAVGGVAAFLNRTQPPSDPPAETDTLAGVLSAARPVVLEKVSLATRVDDRNFPGIVKAVEKTLLSFRIHGPLIEVNVKAGDAVKKGQVLMQVDPRDFEDRIRVLAAHLSRMSAQHRKAAADFERAKTLFSQNVIPQADFDAADSANEETEAAVKDIAAQLQIALHQLKDTSLIAPYDGIITKQHVENHEMIAVGQIGLEMHDISRLEIEVEVPENEIAKHQLTPSESARIQFPSLQGREFKAVLKEWNTSAEPITRTYTVVFVMEAPKDVVILPGMTAQARWVSETASDPVVAIPARSIVSDIQGRPFVWVFDPQSSRARKRFVETGDVMNSRLTHILKGVEPGEFIVTEGASFITEVMELRPLNNDNTAASELRERSES